MYVGPYVFVWLSFSDLPEYCCSCRTILGVAGDDFAIIASDTRLSQGYSIHSRNIDKTYQLWVLCMLISNASLLQVTVFVIYSYPLFRTEKTVLGCQGFHGDVKTFTRNVAIRLKVRLIYSFF